jgi:hypothetical protein
MQRVPITVSMGLQTVTPSLRKTPGFIEVSFVVEPLQHFGQDQIADSQRFPAEQSVE